MGRGGDPIRHTPQKPVSAEGPLLAARDRPLNELLHEGETPSKGGGFKSVPVVACVVNPWGVCTGQSEEPCITDRMLEILSEVAA